MQIFVGYDPREVDAFAVCRSTINKNLTLPIPVYGLVLDDVRKAGLYTRPTETRINSDGHRQLWDVISDAPMATQFSNSRFLIRELGKTGLILFMDCDMLVRGNLCRLFQWIERQESKAVWCVKHNHTGGLSTKMDGQVQTHYSRKNWSSVFVLDAEHPSNRKLTVDLINSVPGRDLHRFCWLEDSDIGELGPEWNYLVGHTPEIINPQIVHFTLGIPSMPGYENCEYADEWRSEREAWARGALHLN